MTQVAAKLKDLYGGEDKHSARLTWTKSWQLQAKGSNA